MVDWNKISCNKCKSCNRKGLPSVMKGSKICEQRRGLITPERASAWDNFKFKLQSIFMNKGFMRKTGPQKKEEEKNEPTEDTYGKDVT